MAQDDSTLYCGCFASVFELCTAAEAFSRVKPQLDFFKLLKLRIKQRTIWFNANAGIANAEIIPEDVWERVKEEVVQDGLEEADRSFYKGATKVVRLDFGAIRVLLSESGLFLASTRIFNVETNNTAPLLPIAFPFPHDTSNTCAAAISITPQDHPIPFSANPGSSIPTIVGSTDFSIPVQRDTSPLILTQSMIDDATLDSVTNNIPHLFERLARLYQLSIINTSRSNNSKEQILLFKM